MVFYKNCSIILASLLGRFAAININKDYKNLVSTKLILEKRPLSIFGCYTLSLYRITYRNNRNKIVTCYELFFNNENFGLRIYENLQFCIKRLNQLAD